MKKYLCIILVFVICLSCFGCSKKDKEIVPQEAQMRSICELATLECYYHNVADYNKKDASGMLWWQKDRKFWIEYAGVVRIGIDATLVKMKVDGENVKITIPPAKVLSCKVDDAALNENSFIVARDSAKVEAEHQTAAFAVAQTEMEREAKANTALLANAQQRAQKLLGNYVNNIGNCVGKTYNIEWEYLEDAEELHNISNESTDTQQTK